MSKSITYSFVMFVILHGCSKACETPLSLKLWHIQITVAHTNSMETLKFLERKILDGCEQSSERSAMSWTNSSEVKQRSERSQRFRFNRREVKQSSECSQRFHFNGSDEVKQCSECRQRFPFKSSEVKQRSERIERYHFSVTYVREIISQ